ncbi:MAG: DEAD/DEAH box helicase [Deltaproteobacteria bacterium]|nr:DEAD/DEAH box helicase [Deltaproteobacteria bacterium]
MASDFDAGARAAHTTPPGAASTPPQLVRFDDMALSEGARAGLKALGYELATPVQAATFGPAMSGKDLIVQSKTGTGKTTAFGLPLIERLRTEEGIVDPQALVLCPTRELAIQVSEELAELGDPMGARVLAIYGGTAMQPQLASLKAGCDVVVGTPGRVLDHIRRRTLRLVHVHLAVLDEADEMLSMGFWDEVTAILDQLPGQRQTFLFSATLPDQIRRAAGKYLRSPDTIDISRDELTVEGITNLYYERDDSLPKPRNLLYLLEVERPDTAIIFCNTRDDASVVAAFLRRQGLNALAISGDFSQKERERIMGRMKRGDLQYLVATDIAARGIDISDLSHVINYSLPEYTEVYVHRVGRTGRIGKKGTAVSLVSGRDEMTFTQLERQFGIHFEKRVLPERRQIESLQAERVAGQLLKVARDTEVTSFLPLAERLKSVTGGTEVIAFLLKHYFSIVEEERERQAREEEQRRDREEEQRRTRDDLERSRRTRRPTVAETPAPAVATASARPAEVQPSPGAPKEAAGDAESGEVKKRGRRRRRNDRNGEGEVAPAGASAGSAASELAPDRVRLFVNRGINDRFDESQIRSLVLEVAGGDAADIARVQLRRTHSFVEVSEGMASAAVAASERGVEREEKPVTIERARTR